MLSREWKEISKNQLRVENSCSQRERSGWEGWEVDVFLNKFCRLTWFFYLYTYLTLTKHFFKTRDKCQKIKKLYHANTHTRTHTQRKSWHQHQTKQSKKIKRHYMIMNEKIPSKKATVWSYILTIMNLFAINDVALKTHKDKSDRIMRRNWQNRNHLHNKLIPGREHNFTDSTFRFAGCTVFECGMLQRLSIDQVQGEVLTEKTREQIMFFEKNALKLETIKKFGGKHLYIWKFLEFTYN